MFVGHFAVAFAAKRVTPKTSLGTLVFGAQFLDLIWPPLVLLGVERFHVEPGVTKLNPLAFDSYPISHSLLMALVWSLLLGAGYYPSPQSTRGGRPRRGRLQPLGAGLADAPAGPSARTWIVRAWGSDLESSCSRTHAGGWDVPRSGDSVRGDDSSAGLARDVAFLGVSRVPHVHLGRQRGRSAAAVFTRHRPDDRDDGPGALAPGAVGRLVRPASRPSKKAAELAVVYKPALSNNKPVRRSGSRYRFRSQPPSSSGQLALDVVKSLTFGYHRSTRPRVGNRGEGDCRACRRALA